MFFFEELLPFLQLNIHPRFSQLTFKVILTQTNLMETKLGYAAVLEREGTHTPSQFAKPLATDYVANTCTQRPQTRVSRTPLTTEQHARKVKCLTL